MDNWTPRPDMSISRFSDHVTLWFIRDFYSEHDLTETETSLTEKEDRRILF